MGEASPIWRPNAFTPEEWAALSREQQSAWWREWTLSAKGRGSGPLRVIENYTQGAITIVEASLSVFGVLTERNVQEFLAACPVPLMQLLRKQSSTLPTDGDDKGWQEFSITGGLCYAPWMTEEEIRRSQDETRRRYREGVRVFRAHDRKGRQ